MYSISLLFALVWVCYSKEYKAVDELNLEQYVGKWYQVYQDKFNKLFQGNGRCAPAEYAITGTITTYSTVKTAEFATSVYNREIC